MLVQCNIAKGQSYFFITLTLSCMLFKLFMPVDKIIGFFFFAICSIRGRLLHSPDPILKHETFISSSLSAASLEKGVEIKIIPIFLVKNR